MRKALIPFLLLVAGGLNLRGQSATVEVLSTYDPIPEETPSVPVDMMEGSSLHRAGGGGSGSAPAGNPTGCRHLRLRFQAAPDELPDWGNAHNGDLLQSSSLVNRTSLVQSYTREVKATVKSTVEGSLSLSLACAKVQVAVEAEVKDTFPIAVPPRSTVSFSAFSKLQDRPLNVLKVCATCNEVLAVEPGKVHAAFGVNARYE